jgi:hypothetical protein
MQEMHIRAVSSPSVQNKNRLSVCLSPTYTPASGPLLVPFTTDFAILNLEY